MSIGAQVEVSRREWGGELNPSHPIGMWMGAGLVQGDASGGTMNLDFVFQLQGAPNLDSQIYSLEQIAIHVEAPTSQTISLRTSVLGELSAADEWAIELRAFTQGGDAAILPRDAGALKGTFMGSATAVGSTTALQVSAVNADGIDLIMSAQGYVWGARSRSVLGGPKRPVDGLYSG